MQYLSPLILCVSPRLEYESSLLQSKFAAQREFWNSYFILDMAKVRKAHSKSRINGEEKNQKLYSIRACWRKKMLLFYPSE